MKNFKNYLFALLWISSLSVLIQSCSKDNPKPQGEFSSGVLVVNEGSFGHGDGTVSYFNPATSEVKQDIFGLKNGSLALGDVVQSVTVHDDMAYVVVNNSNKMEVVNAHTFVSQYTLTGLKLPRYMTVLSGKGYVTEWVSFTDAGRVSVIDLENKKVEKTITTDFGAESIIAANGKLFVSNNFTNTVSMINPATGEVSPITVNDSPAGFVLDKNNSLWVICSGGYDQNFAPLNNGALVKLNASTGQVEKTIDLKMNTAGHLVANKAKDQLYFHSGKSIYKVSTSSAVAPSAAFINASTFVGVYGIGVDPQTDNIYVSDSKGFQANGTVTQYKNDGSVIDTFAAGKGPNGFVFK